MAPNKPGEKVVRIEPGAQTGDSVYVTESGQRYRSRDGYHLALDPSDRDLFAPSYVARPGEP